jgi:hypothetical protein
MISPASKESTLTYNQMYDKFIYAFAVAMEGSKGTAELKELMDNGYPADYIRALYTLPFEQYLKNIRQKLKQGSEAGDETTLDDLEEQLENLLADIEYSDSLTELFPEEPELNDPWSNIRTELEEIAYEEGIDGVSYLVDVFLSLHHRGQTTYGEASIKLNLSEFQEATQNCVESLVKIIKP